MTKRMMKKKKGGEKKGGEGRDKRNLNAWNERKKRGGNRVA